MYTGVVSRFLFQLILFFFSFLLLYFHYFLVFVSSYIFLRFYRIELFSLVITALSFISIFLLRTLKLFAIHSNRIRAHIQMKCIIKQYYWKALTIEFMLHAHEARRTLNIPFTMQKLYLTRILYYYKTYVHKYIDKIRWL